MGASVPYDMQKIAHFKSKEMFILYLILRCFAASVDILVYSKY